MGSDRAQTGELPEVPTRRRATPLLPRAGDALVPRAEESFPAVSALSVGGPFFDDLKVGDVYGEAPSVTLTFGHATFHQAVTGDRLRLPLDSHLSLEVTGQHRPLAHPLLVCNVAIGQTTTVTQRVKANLFYRGLVLLRPVFLGDTLRTTTEVVALKQNRRQPGRQPTGLAVLRVRTENQDGERVLDFWRCPMLPLRNEDVETGAADSFDAIPADLDWGEVGRAVPGDWDLAPFRRATAATAGGFPAGSVLAIDGRDTVSSATELARLTLNLASAHHDPGIGQQGRRLVYGGHTIAVAGAHVSRALPNIVTLVAWRSCDHTGPVFEGDLLRTQVTVEEVRPREAGGDLVDLRALVWAQSEGEEDERPVLDWSLVAWSA